MNLYMHLYWARIMQRTNNLTTQQRTTQTQARAHTHSLSRTHTHTHTHTRTRAQTHTYILQRVGYDSFDATSKLPHTHIYTHTCTHTQAHTHTHTHTFTHTHAHTHTHNAPHNTHTFYSASVTTRSMQRPTICPRSRKCSKEASSLS